MKENSTRRDRETSAPDFLHGMGWLGSLQVSAVPCVDGDKSLIGEVSFTIFYFLPQEFSKRVSTWRVAPTFSVVVERYCIHSLPFGVHPVPDALL